MVPGTGRGLDRDPQGAEQSGFPGIIKMSGNIGTGLSEAPHPPPPSLHSTIWTIVPCTRTTVSALETPNAVGVKGPAKLHCLLGPPRGL